MTYKEKLQLTAPEEISDTYCGGCLGCPSDHEWGKDAVCLGKILARNCTEDICKACWEREMPKEEQAEELIEIKIEEEKKMRNLGDIIRDAVLNAIDDSDIEDAVKNMFENYDYSDMIERAVENYLYENIEDIADDIVTEAVRDYMKDNL